MSEQAAKKDFFKEYDQMCKEVDNLRRQNQNIAETLKKLQEK